MQWQLRRAEFDGECRIKMHYLQIGSHNLEKWLEE